MIEIIRAYTGVARAEGKVKVTEAPMFRCTKCGNIKPSFNELKQEGCTKHEHRSSIQK
jgi:hypothetical protein